MTAACGLALAVLALPSWAGEQRPLLFVPDPVALDWPGFRSIVSSAALPFTAALSPAQTPASELGWLREAAASGRLELAARLEHDPMLVLFTRRRPQALVERLAAERAAFRAAFGAEPRGFVAAGAALDPAALRMLAAQGFSWTAAGAGGRTGPWETEGILAVPFRPAAAGEENRRPEAGEPPGTVLDETAVLPPGQALAMLKEALKPGGQRWTTADAYAAREGAATEPGPPSWPAWGGADAWLDAPAAQRARELFDQACKAVERYQNSGAASLIRLEAAGAALNRGAAAVNFKPGAPLEALLGDLAAALNAAGETAGASSGGVTASALAAGVAFTAEARSSTAPWLPVALKVERQGDDLSLTVTLAGLTADPAGAAGFSGLTLEVYIDVNGLAGSGATRLLGDRRSRVAARDAWEFAVTADGQGAALWRVGQPRPAKLEDLPAQSSPEKGEIRLRLPGRRLRGNPAGWGFLTLTTPAGASEPAGLLGATAEELPASGPPPILKAARLISR